MYAGNSHFTHVDSDSLQNVRFSAMEVNGVDTTLPEYGSDLFVSSRKKPGVTRACALEQFVCTRQSCSVDSYISKFILQNNFLSLAFSDRWQDFTLSLTGVNVLLVFISLYDC